MNDYAIFGALAFFLLIAGAIVVHVLFLLNLQNTLKQVSPQNRKIQPGQVWMVLIPFFGIVWYFIMVQRIGKSLKAEFTVRQLPVGYRPGQPVGMIMCILGCCSIIPYLNILTVPAATVLFIIYWVKMAGYKRQLINSNA